MYQGKSCSPSIMLFFHPTWSMDAESGVKAIKIIWKKLANFKTEPCELSTLKDQESIFLQVTKFLFKLEDLIKQNNCHFSHDYLHKNLTKCFENYTNQKCKTRLYLCTIQKQHEIWTQLYYTSIPSYMEQNYQRT